jgi:hypothetical protein
VHIRAYARKQIRGRKSVGREAQYRNAFGHDVQSDDVFFGIAQDRVDPNTGEILPAINIWLSAASHIFYSLGLGQGMLITYSSYNPPTYPIRYNSLIVSVANSATEIFGGFATFSILGALSPLAFDTCSWFVKTPCSHKGGHCVFA